MGFWTNTINRTFSPVFKALNREVGIRGAEPRKGNWQWMAGTPSKKVMKSVIINSATLKQLSNTDPITWAIKATRKTQITQTKWDIVPDTERLEAELDRWFSTIINNLNPWGFQEVFHPSVIDRDLYVKAATDIKEIVGSVLISKEDRKSQLKWYFESLKRKVKQEAADHCRIVKRIFDKPNDSECKTFRTLLEILVDDILTFDAGVIVKNKNAMGELAELYPIPGAEVKIYRNPDRTIPQPPEPAYVWEENGVIRAEYDKTEIVNIMANPQHNGYGQSPLEVAAYIITSSLYADEYNIDFFRHSNVPPAIMNLGKNITEEQRVGFQTQWDNEVAGQGGLHKMMFLGGADSPQYIPIRNMSSREMQMMEYLKWTLSIKCACFQISPQDISFIQDFHRTTAEVQKELTKSRGIRNLLSLLETHFNTEIVKPCFPFRDVKFQWQEIDLTDEVQQSGIDIADINNGVISRNDRRKRIGLPPIEGGDAILVNLGNAGFVPIEDLVPSEEKETAEQPIEEAMKEKEAGGIDTGLGGKQAEATQGAIDSIAGQPEGRTAKQGLGKPDMLKPEQPKPELTKKPVEILRIKIANKNKIEKVMNELKKQGLGDNEVKLTLEK